MKEKKNLTTGAGVVLLIGSLCQLSWGQVNCTDQPLPGYCQVKVAQVPFPWQFWSVLINPPNPPIIIDKIRISPTWLNPVGPEPPGTGVVAVRRWQAVINSPAQPLPLEALVWDFNRDMPAGPLSWRPVEDPKGPPQVLSDQQDLPLEIEVGDTAVAVLVAYEVLLENEVVGHFINEAVLGSPDIIEVRVNFDVHNNTLWPATNFELDFLGLDFSCADIVAAIGFIANPPGPVWGVNPIVVRPIPGGTEVKWVQPDRPLKFCEWLHGGLLFRCDNFGCFIDPPDPVYRATVQAYWTILEPKICDPKTQGYWKRICDGATGLKPLHPETPAGFDTSLCTSLQVQGNERSDPCLRAQAQFAALQLNVKYGYLSRCCLVKEASGKVLTVTEALVMIEQWIASGDPKNCKKAADLADSINSGTALVP